MRCVIYRSRRRRGTYLYVQLEDDLARVPPALLTLLGELERVLTVELTAQRKLAQADGGQVRRQLAEQGYYLQLPPGDFPSLPS